MLAVLSAYKHRSYPHLPYSASKRLVPVGFGPAATTTTRLPGVKCVSKVSTGIGAGIFGARLASSLISVTGRNDPRYILRRQTQARLSLATSGTFPGSSRKCSGESGNSKGGISRSKSCNLPFTRNDLDLRSVGQLLTPSVVVSSPADEVIVTPRCKGLICLFYAQDPVKYARCSNRCTFRGGDCVYQLKRHLRNHEGDVDPEVYRAAWESFGVRHTGNDNRSRREGNKLSQDDKLAAIYRRCRKILFDVDEREPIHQRRKSSNRGSDAASDHSHMARSRSRRARANSRASSSHTIAPRCDASASNRDLDSQSVNASNTKHPSTMRHDRLTMLTDRLARLFMYTSSHREYRNHLLSMLDDWELQLDDYERDVLGNHTTANVDTQAMSPPGSNQQLTPQSAMMAAWHQYPLPDLEQPDVQSGQMAQDSDIDLNSQDARFAVFQDQNLLVQPNNNQADATWQQRVFGTENRPQQDQSQHSNLPVNFEMGNLAPPSFVSQSTGTSLGGTVDGSFFQHNNLANVPWDSMSSQHYPCTICHASPCACTNTVWSQYF